MLLGREYRGTIAYLLTTGLSPSMVQDSAASFYILSPAWGLNLGVRGLLWVCGAKGAPLCEAYPKTPKPFLPFLVFSQEKTKGLLC